ncbi:MAG: glycoside hydrolase family 113 [Chitinispirillaceae bacterium]
MISLLLGNCTDTFFPDQSHDYHKGMSIFFKPPRNAFHEQDFDESLDRLKSDGVNSLFLTPCFFQKTPRSDSIFSTDATIIDENLISAVKMARSAGFSVGLKPHIDVLDGEPRHTIDSRNWNRWFRFYRNYIIHYARMAEQLRVPLLVIGTELDNAASRPEFTELIETVRDEFSGEITYASSYNDFLSLDFWGDLDYVGVNCWFNLDNGEGEPEQIYESWNHWLNLLSEFGSYHNRPVLITEAGFRNIEKAAANPGDWSYTGEADMQLQSECYAGLLSQMNMFPRIAGVYWWQWELGKVGGPGNTDYTPRGKPAEEQIRKYWF